MAGSIFLLARIRNSHNTLEDMAQGADLGGFPGELPRLRRCHTLTFRNNQTTMKSTGSRVEPAT
jgi:hypothetical protein